jgi:dethiobiotin synthetase
MKQYFVTGTDTEVGKTLVSCVLMREVNANGLDVVGLKPIASGAESIDNQMCNEDALALMENSTVGRDLPYEIFNPNLYREAIAPHIAAKTTQRPIELERVNRSIDILGTCQPDVMFIEGAGGWRLPLSSTVYFSSWVAARQLPVILVVGLRLGCINHAILTAEAIMADGLEIAGWVANQLSENMPFEDDNIETLRVSIKAPFLGKLPYLQDMRGGLGNLDIAPLLD